MPNTICALPLKFQDERDKRPSDGKSGDCLGLDNHFLDLGLGFALTTFVLRPKQFKTTDDDETRLIAEGW